MLKIHPNPRTDKIANEIVSCLANEKSVLGLFLSGSSSYGGNDEYSDVDLGILTKNRQKLKVYLIERLLPQHNLIFYFEPHYLTNFLVTYIDKGAKFDFNFFQKGDFENQNLTGIKIITDKSNYLKHIKSKQIKPHQSLNRLEILSLAVADLIAVQREVKRGDLFEARQNLDEARYSIATYINFQNGNHYYGFDSFELYLSKRARNLMHKSLSFNDDLRDISKAASVLMKVIDEIGSFPKDKISLIKKFKIH